MRSGGNGYRSAVPLHGVRKRHGTGRRRFRGTVLLLGLLAALLQPCTPAYSASQFLLAERPDHFLVYNTYQQTLTPNERALLTPFVPMRIIQSDDLLGDGFTPCMTVEIQGKRFYLVRGKNGELSGSERAGAIRHVTGAVLLEDTIAVLTGGAFSVIVPAGDVRRSVRRGERLVRYFQEGEQTFVGTTDQPPVYGFVRIPPSARRQTWDVYRPVEGEVTAIPQRILTAVQDNIKEVNRVYKGLYAFFNRQTGEQRPIPYWNVSNSSSAIVCTLVNHPPGADLSQSTRYLIKDLENALLGTSLRLSSTVDRIEIRMEQVE